MAGPTDDLAFFATLAAHETLTAASRELASSLPVVSKRLAALEARLGVQLVRRGSRRLVLTAEGAVYAHRAAGILAEVRDLEDQVAGQSEDLRGALVVESTLGLGRAHVGPLLGELGALHPGLDIQLTTTALPLSPHRRGFDIAVQVGAPHDSTLRMRRLAENRRVVCAAPEYLRRHPAPTSVEDLADHNCIVLRESYGEYAVWHFGDGSGPGPEGTRVRVAGTLSSSDGDTVTGWALEGRGLVMRSLWQVAPMLADGRLVQVLADVPTPPADVHALYSDARHVPARVVAALDFLARGLPARLALAGG